MNTFVPDVTQKPPFFQNFRDSPWRPRFHIEKTVSQVADAINAPHEDYPNRVPATEAAIRFLQNENPTTLLTVDCIRTVHRMIFPDHAHRAGEWRTSMVRIGNFIPPRWEILEKLMIELQERYKTLPLTPETLRLWYTDFETIHPFIDGNGRVGGVILAVASHLSLKDKFLAPGQ